MVQHTFWVAMEQDALGPQNWHSVVSLVPDWLQRNSYALFTQKNDPARSTFQNNT
jgi:hypothetical protein